MWGVSHQYIYSSHACTKADPTLFPPTHTIPTMIKKKILGVKNKMEKKYIKYNTNCTAHLLIFLFEILSPARPQIFLTKVVYIKHVTTLLLCGVFPLLPQTHQPFGTVWNQLVLPLFRILLDFDGEGRQTSSNWFDFFFFLK